MKQYIIKQQHNLYTPQYKDGWKTLWFWSDYTQIVDYDENVIAIYGSICFNTLDEAQQFIDEKKKYDKIEYYEN